MVLQGACIAAHAGGLLIASPEIHTQKQTYYVKSGTAGVPGAQ